MAGLAWRRDNGQLETAINGAPEAVPARLVRACDLDTLKSTAASPCDRGGYVLAVGRVGQTGVPTSARST